MRGKLSSTLSTSKFVTQDSSCGESALGTEWQEGLSWLNYFLSNILQHRTQSQCMEDAYYLLSTQHQHRLIWNPLPTKSLQNYIIASFLKPLMSLPKTQCIVEFPLPSVCEDTHTKWVLLHRIHKFSEYLFFNVVSWRSRIINQDTGSLVKRNTALIPFKMQVQRIFCLCLLPEHTTPLFRIKPTW